MRVLAGSAKMSAEIGQQQNNMRRFYKQASVIPNPKPKHPLHKHLLVLDGKTIKTPYRNPLAFPSEKLAFLVANQFNRQQKFLKTGEMPLLALARTAVDADIEGHLAVHLQHTIHEYLKTDTLLFEDIKFEEEHKNSAVPLISFFSDKFGMELTPSATIQPPIMEINKNFISWLGQLNNWQLIGMQTMTIWMKSTIAAVSVAQSPFDPISIQRATYLQQLTQMKTSGEVEQRLMDINQIRMMVSCGQIMYRYAHP